MLRFEFTDINNERLILDNPVYIVINQDENIPADDLTVTFPLIKNISELCEVEAFDGDKKVFRGIVDEQQSILDNNSYYTRITARSMAAALLDNESRPVNYTDVSTSVIFNRHLLPNNITSYKGEDKVLKGSFNISKGMSDWQAFSMFCLRVFNKVPRIEPDAACFTGGECEDELKFSNVNGIRYNSIKENIKRHKIISDVIIKPVKSDNYNTVYNDSFSKSHNIIRKRYVDIFSEKDYDTARMILENSRKNSFEITLTTPRGIIDKLGAKVSIEDENLGNLQGLYISSIYYCLTPEKEETTLILKRN